MTSGKLENLVKTGTLKKEARCKNEISGLYNSGIARFKDAKNKALSVESRFDLAYNAAHSLSLAALTFACCAVISKLSACESVHCFPAAA